MVDTPSPLVSVIINCYNSAEYLAEAIDSVFAQTFTDWEIIFWDNASTDSSAEIARGYSGKLKYFRSSQTFSLGHARNLALAQAHGKYIAFLDCDDLWCPEKLEQQVNMFNVRPDVGLIFSNVEFFSKGKPSFLAFRRHKPPEGMVLGALVRSYFLPMPAVMIRRSVLDHMDSCFDERFSIVEEADLFMRIAHDYPIGYCPGILAKVRFHPGNLTSRQPELFVKEKKMLLEKFQALWPDFEDQYRNDIAYFREGIECHQGNLDWEKGNGSEARRRFWPYLMISPRRWISYLLSYFPYPVYRILREGYKVLMQSFRGKFGEMK